VYKYQSVLSTLECAYSMALNLVYVRQQWLSIILSQCEWFMLSDVCECLPKYSRNA